MTLVNNNSQTIDCKLLSTNENPVQLIINHDVIIIYFWGYIYSNKKRHSYINLIIITHRM